MAFEMVSIPQELNKFRFELAPAHNALSSLWLLNFEGINHVDWIRQTRDKLTVNQLVLNEEVCWPAATFLRGKTWESFPAWLEHLAAQDPIELAMYDLNNLLDRISVYTGKFSANTADDLYQDSELYANVVKTIYEYTHWTFNKKEVLAEHHTLSHPEKMEERKENILSHLTMMWEEHLSAEWERNLSLLEDSVTAYRSIDLQGLTDSERLAKITGSGEKLLKAWLAWLPTVREVICFPNPHIVSYSLVIDRTANSVFAAMTQHVSNKIANQSPQLSRSFLKSRLNTLADDTRLRIIELLVAEPGLSAKEIQEKLNLSQSATSRHIKQLGGSGFVWATRSEGANKFEVCPDILDELHQGLKQLFGQE